MTVVRCGGKGPVGGHPRKNTGKKRQDSIGYKRSRAEESDRIAQYLCCKRGVEQHSGNKSNGYLEPEGGKN